VVWPPGRNIESGLIIISSAQNDEKRIQPQSEDALLRQLAFPTVSVVICQPFGRPHWKSRNLSGAYAKVLDFPYSGPIGQPMQASDGNLWIKSTFGGISVITLSGTVLLNFQGPDCPTGYPSLDAFTQGVDGKLYTSWLGCGGSYDTGGAIIQVDAALPPPKPTIAAFTPASGLSGSTVVLSGTYFVSPSAVSFNGVSAGFVVKAAGVITATVPAGASSGPIQVTTPGGTVTSRADFTVTP
jgi:hypothetical protein